MADEKTTSTSLPALSSYKNMKDVAYDTLSGIPAIVAGAQNIAWISKKDGAARSEQRLTVWAGNGGALSVRNQSDMKYAVGDVVHLDVNLGMFDDSIEIRVSEG